MLMTLCLSQAFAAEKVIRLDIKTGKFIKFKQKPDSIVISDPNVMTMKVKTPTMIYVYAEKLGSTNLIALDKQGNKIDEYVIEVQIDLSTIRRTIARVHPEAKIEMFQVASGIMLKGEVKSTEVAENIRRILELYVNSQLILNFLHITTPPQINLRVKVVEMSRSVFRRFGINWNAIRQFNSPNRSFAFDSAIPRPSTTDNNFFFTATFPFMKFDITAFIDVLESEGLATILSEPNLTTLSGDTATFLAGGEFPIPKPSTGDGNSSITIEFKEFGVSLAFTPTLLHDNLINLHVRPEVSQLSSEGAIRVNNITVPALLTRRAETTVELHSGESFIIAGLLQSNVIDNLQKFPRLAEIPFFKKLFEARSYTRNESELIIIVTPYVVKPVHERNIALPSDDIPAAQITRYDVQDDGEVGFITK